MGALVMYQHTNFIKPDKIQLWVKALNSKAIFSLSGITKY